jgi:hypothetical protein
LILEEKHPAPVARKIKPALKNGAGRSHGNAIIVRFWIAPAADRLVAAATREVVHA